MLDCEDNLTKDPGKYCNFKFQNLKKINKFFFRNVTTVVTEMLKKREKNPYLSNV